MKRDQQAVRKPNAEQPKPEEDLSEDLPLKDETAADVVGGMLAGPVYDT